MRILLVLGLPILAVLLVVAMIASKDEPPKSDRPNLDPVVETLVLAPMTANFTVTSQGTVRPKTETVLSSEISGTITSISPKFAAGGVFSRNEVLLRIDPSNYEAAVNQASALVNQRQIEYDGASKLRTQGYRAESEYASAAAALASAKAALKRANRDLQRTFIRLPYAGMVRTKIADLGQFVSPGTQLGVTFSTDHAEVRLPLTDQDLAFVDLPNASQISEAGYAEGPAVTLTAIRKGKVEEWPAVIARSEGVVDENSRVTYAVAQIADPYGLDSERTALPIGTFVRAFIDGSSAENVFRIPRAYVRGSDELVMVGDDRKLEIRHVRIIRSDADYIYVGADVVSGERIVATALETPVSGMSVRLAEDGTATPDAVSGSGSE